MTLREQIIQALNTPSKDDPSLGVWFDGPTLETSSIKISRELNTDTGTLTKAGKWIPLIDPDAYTYIDILSDIGTGKGSVSDYAVLAKKFKELQKTLPPGRYALNANTAKKARVYAKRVFKNDPWVTFSGEQGSERIRRPDGSWSHERFDTLELNVPGDEERIKTRPTRSGKHLGEVPDEVVSKEFDKYIQKRYNPKGLRVEDNAFIHNGVSYGFEKGSSNNALLHDGEGYKLYISHYKKVIEANRRAKKLKATPSMTVEEWMRLRDIYRQASVMGLEVDHIQPLELGGLHHPNNLQLLTREYNRQKGYSYSSDLKTRQLDWSDKAVPIKPRLAHDAKDYKWAQKKSNQIPSTLRHIDGFGVYGRKADIAVNIGANLVAGNPLGAALGTTPLVLRNRRVQKGLFELAARYGSKRLQKLVPVAGGTLSAVEAGGYALQGRPIQAGAATLSGILTEFNTPLTEGASAVIDLGNTITDALTGNFGGPPDPEDGSIRTRNVDFNLPSRTTFKHLGIL